MESKKLRLFNKLSFVSLIGTLFLVMFFFIPYVSVGLEVSKGFLLSIGMSLSLFFWLVARLIDGKFTIPKDRIILFAFLIPVVFLVSSMFSLSQHSSFFGKGFEIGTFGSMMTLFLLMFLSSIYFQTEKKINIFFKSIFMGATILALFEILHIIFNFERILPGSLRGLSFGNLLGTWNNFAVFFGGVVILSLITLELNPVSRLRRVWLAILTIVSLFLLALVNNTFVWILVGSFAIIIFVYSISSQQFLIKTEQIKEKKLPVLSFMVILVSLLFIFSSGSFGSMISNYFGVVSNEVRPSFLGTFQVIKKAFLYNPVFGTGPNTFLIDWSMWKPNGIILSQFWNYDFSNGISFYFTSLATTGLIGFLSMTLVIIIFLFRGMQSMFVAFKNPKANYFIFGSFLSALYFWLVVILFVPSIVNLMLAFALTGLFLGVLVYRQVLPIYDGSFLKDPRTSFFSILGLVLFIIISVTMTYLYVSKFVGTLYVSKIQTLDNSEESVKNIERNLLRAINMNNKDDYHRALSQVYVSKIDSVANNSSISEDTAKVAFQNIVTQAEGSALNATRLNPKYYVNWVNLGDVYTVFTSLGVSGAYDNAMNSYKKAMELSSNNPSVLLAMAQLEVYNKNNSEARNLLNQALEVKPNYIDAMFALARLDTNEGKLDSAIKQAERATLVAPNDPSIFFNLGILRYNNKNYTSAASAFDTAVRLAPNYTNARYFLGVSYQKIGRTEDARAQFELLNQAFPENEDIKKALDSVNSGKSIIEDVAEDTENIKDLPIVEENKKK